MDKKIIILIEGIDGTGKSTLANMINETLNLLNKKSSVIHSSYDPSWNIESYHKSLLEDNIDNNDVLIFDRWCISEYAYGNGFRVKSSYNVFNFLKEIESKYEVIHIHAHNNEQIKNFDKLKNERTEMFDDVDKMKTVAGFFTDFYYCMNIQPINYDYTKFETKQNFENWVYKIVNKMLVSEYEFALTYVRETNTISMWSKPHCEPNWMYVKSFENIDSIVQLSLPEIIDLVKASNTSLIGSTTEPNSNYPYEYIYCYMDKLYKFINGEWLKQSPGYVNKSIRELFNI